MQTITKSEKRVLDYIRRHLAAHGNEAPSYHEIARGLGLKTVSNIHTHVEKLVAKGYLKKRWNSGRSVELTEPSRPLGATVELQLAGTIVAGKPIEAVEQVETMTVPADMVGKNETYVLRVQGDSMIEDHVIHGDHVIVEKRNWARDGEMVVALIGNQDATLKRFYRDKDKIRLQPANPSYPPMIYDEKDVTIQGVVVGILRRYR